MDVLVPIRSVVGKPIPLRGNEIDTDRIIPARFMKAITFDGLGKYAFFDARFDANGNELGHIMDDPRFMASGPRIAVVNKNFGCGSSREHAPQALYRWGIKALVGESFADIFFGNCVALGMPCVTLTQDDVLALLELVDEDPRVEVELDLESCEVRRSGRVFRCHLPPGARKQLLEGTWDATRVLLSAAEAVRETASRLPYMNGFRA
jgi:3-isopropylmalate/(R)-2-methylmalate dehydratase small subunit